MSSLGGDVADFCAAVGLVLDDWQRLALDVILSTRADGRWAAIEAGLIVPRQNGKGAVIEAIELADLFLLGTKLILHSTHHFKTTLEGFLRVKSWIDNTDDLRRRVRTIRTSHGEEAIEMRSGQRLRFVARSRVSGRGFSGDRIILDEALELPEPAISALIPTMSARPNPQVLYTSSAPLDASTVLHRIRRRGRDGDPTLAYLEWSGEDPWEANPAMGLRIPEEFVEMESRSMTRDAFRAERLGLTPDIADGSESVWPVGAWDACCDPALTPDVGLVIGVDVHPDRTSAAVGAADALGRVELVDAQPGVGWVVERAVSLAVKHNARVAVQSTGPAGALIPDLERAGVRVVPVTQGDVRAACGAFYDAVAARQRFIRWHDVLNRAAGSAIRKDSGDGWVFDRRAGADVSPLYAVLLARWAATSQTTITPTVINLNDYLEGDDD